MKMEQALAGFGLGKIVVIDPDIVENHNLSRQLPYKNDDIGENKDRIEERIPNDSTIVEASEEYIDEDNVDIEGATLCLVFRERDRGRATA